MFPIAAAISLAIGLIDPTGSEEVRQLQAELARFPSLEEANAWVAFGNAHLLWINSLPMRGPNCNALPGWSVEAFAFVIQWNALSGARDPANCLSQRWILLQGLKEELSPEDWLLGRMPLPPLHRFENGPPPEWIKSFSPKRPARPMPG